MRRSSRQFFKLGYLPQSISSGSFWQPDLMSPDPLSPDPLSPDPLSPDLKHPAMLPTRENSQCIGSEDRSDASILIAIFQAHGAGQPDSPAFFATRTRAKARATKFEQHCLRHMAIENYLISSNSTSKIKASFGPIAPWEPCSP